MGIIVEVWDVHNKYMLYFVLVLGSIQATGGSTHIYTPETSHGQTNNLKQEYQHKSLYCLCGGVICSGL